MAPPPELCLPVCSPCGEHRSNIGLNLKFNKKNEEVPGYTKRTEKEWLYSAAVEEVLAEYLDRSGSPLRIFTCVYLAVSCSRLKGAFCLSGSLKCFSPCPRTYTMTFSTKMTSGLRSTRTGTVNMHTNTLLTSSGVTVGRFFLLSRAEKVAEITSWLRSHPVSSATRTSCELQVLDAAIVEKIEEAVEKVKVREAAQKRGAPVTPSFCTQLKPPSLPAGEEEHQEGARDGEASSPFQSKFLCVQSFRL